MSSRITPPSADTDSTSRRRWTFVLAALVLVVVVVAAILLLVNRGDDSTTAPPPATQPTGSVPTSGTTSAPSEQPSSTGPQKCDLPAGSQTIPSTPIHGADWSLVYGRAVPGAKAYGPQIIDPDGLRRCFAHSPVGAVFAIYNFITAMSPPNDSTGEQAIAALQRIMTPGANRDRYFDYLRTPDDSGSSDSSVQLAGFKVVDATPDRVNVQVAFQGGNGFASSSWTLTWSGSDWLVVAPQPGDRAGDPYTPLTDLTGFVPWRGVA